MQKESLLQTKDLRQLTHQFRGGAASPVETCAAVFDRIEQRNPELNAFSLLCMEDAASAARASETRWKNGEPLSPIDGVPCTVKDLVLSKDWPTTFGSAVLGQNTPSNEDSPVVARLKQAGAVIVGLTTTPELGWKAVTDSKRFGITRNPWDISKTPGGSSGGAAAAAAADLGVLHVGTDGGGSIRIPASFCGIVGHKPSFGRVPAYPISAFGTVAHVGPMARTVYDTAAMLSVISQSDSRDWYALKPDSIRYEDHLETSLKGKKFGYSLDLGHIDVAPQIADAFLSAIKVFETLGAEVIEVTAPINPCQSIFHDHWFAGAGYRIRHLDGSQKAQLDPGLIEIATQGQDISLHQYIQAGQIRAELGAKMIEFHETYDYLLTPTTPIPAFDAGLEFPAESNNTRWTDWAGFSYPFNLTQQPACSVPCGFTDQGLPIGLQIVGPRYADLEVLQAAYAFEQAYA
ncbi:amidase [Thalassospira lucentensis]|uniref:amidase n=1 Tax=Thalassospira lucentensis TaxID=168935 RepID=UPI00142D30BE|nr:amidase [Thalassospira lucentensis]NIZ01937.1 amidase [Thalassospira lucentensis]